jgi:hypothetical protein
LLLLKLLFSTFCFDWIKLKGMENVEIKTEEAKLDLKRKNESTEESISKKVKLPKRKVVLIIGSSFLFSISGYNGIKYQGTKLFIVTI